MKKQIMVGLTGLMLTFSTQAQAKMPKPVLDDQPGVPAQTAEWWEQYRQALAEQEARGGRVDNKDAKPETNFYTGKIYEVELGTYLFKFRNYSPATMRWISADPSGFPDGANNYAFVTSPCSSLDVWGLDTVTVTGSPTTDQTLIGFTLHVQTAAHQVGNSIQASMVVQWQVSSDFTGWIVQNIIRDATNVYNDSDNSKNSSYIPNDTVMWGSLESR